MSLKLFAVAYALRSLERAALLEGENTRAIKLLEESLALDRAVGDRAHLAWVYLFLARAVLHQGETTRAYILLEESLALRKGDRTCLFTTNRPEHTITFIAAASICTHPTPRSAELFT